MSEFDIFFDEYENKHNCSPEKYECYEAGAQSKQAEIDELRKSIDKADRLIMSFGDSIDVHLRNSLIDAIRGLEDL